LNGKRHRALPRPGRSTLAMLHDWGVIAAAFGYIGFLFLVACPG
jgi:hypothetical protein